MTRIDQVNDWLFILDLDPATDVEIRRLELLGYDIAAKTSFPDCLATEILQVLLYWRESSRACSNYNSAVLDGILKEAGCPFIPNPFPDNPKEVNFFVGVGVQGK